MDTEAWWATVHEVTKVRHNRACTHKYPGSQGGIHTATCKGPRQPGLYPYDQFRQPRLQREGCGLNEEPSGNRTGEAGSLSTIPGEEAYSLSELLFSSVQFSHSVVSDSLQPHGLYSSPGSSVHRILQARILEWVAISFSRGSS